MAKSQNPMEAFRREQKKKELKKNQTHRQREKQAKLHELDVDEIRDRLKKLERQVQQNPADGPTRKRKQELENTLQGVLKKQKAMEEEEKEKEAATKTPVTLEALTAANRERYQNPENSIYYDRVLNPFGAPPPGRPQMYRVPPPKPVTASKTSAQQSGRQKHDNPSHRSIGGGSRAPGPPPSASGRRRGPARPQRPGKRPPLPPGPPPPGTIQVPPRPPLPSANEGLTNRPPPPPPAPTPASQVNALVPPPPPPVVQVLHQTAPSPPPPPPAVMRAFAIDVSMEDSDVVGVYPPPEEGDAEDENAVGGLYPHLTDSRRGVTETIEEEDEERAEQQQRLRSLVPTTLRVQRAMKPKTLATAVPRPAPPLPPRAPGPMLPSAPLPFANLARPVDASSSVSDEFDAFMEEMKDLGAV